MPQHHIMLTTPERVTIELPVLPAMVERAVLICNFRGLQLRRLNADETAFELLGKYRPAKVVLENFKANALAELYGFQAQEITTGDFGGSVGYQLSNDNGTSWLVWDDAFSAWVPPIGDVFMSAALVDRRIPQFPLTSARQLRVRVLLTPTADGKKTPKLDRVTFYVEHQYDFQEDLVRSLKHYLEQRIQVSAKFYDEAASPVTTVTVEVDWAQVLEPIRVYNLTTDPDRTANLFASVLGKVITLAAPQVGALEVAFVGVPKVFIAADEDFQLSTIPSIVINVPTIVERRELRNGNGEVDRATERREARTRVGRVFFDATTLLGCQSALKREALVMADAIVRIMSQDRVVPSEAIGEDMTVVTALPVSQADQVGRALYASNVSVALGGKAWLAPGERKNIALDIRARVHPVVTLDPKVGAGEEVRVDE